MGGPGSGRKKGSGIKTINNKTGLSVRQARSVLKQHYSGKSKLTKTQWINAQKTLGRKNPKLF